VAFGHLQRKNEGKRFMVELLWLVYLGLKETTSVGVLAATGIAVGQEEEMEKLGLLLAWCRQ
jgi:hypothetical protein